MSNRHDMFELAEATAFSQRAITEIVDAVTEAKLWPLTIVISGFQTGADQGGSRAGKACGYATGGMMPKGFLTEDGPRPDLAAEFGAVESQQEGYEHRTRWNINNSDATLIFVYRTVDGGSLFTERFAKHVGKLALVVQVLPGTMPTCVPDVRSIRHWLQACHVRTVNIAGNRESKSPGIGVAVETLCLEILRKP